MKFIFQELTIIKFIGSCRTILRIIGETLEDYCIRKVEQWYQIFCDGTGRHQTAIQNLVINVIDEKHLRPLILSTFTILEGNTSEYQVDSVMSTILGCRKLLQRWAEVLEHLNPSYQTDISEPISMNIGKLGSGGDLTSYTCNGARKTRRLIVEQVHEYAEALCKDGSDDIRVLDDDCWNHLRNLWLGGIKKDLSTLIGNTLREELYGIKLRLRVSTIIKSVLRVVNKEFSLCANYPKGHRELFREWIETYHPGALIIHVERASGSCQDLVVDGIGAV